MTGHRAGGAADESPVESVYAVDRVEGRGDSRRVIVVSDDGRELDVPFTEFAPDAGVEEGAVYRVNPRSLDWRTATRDRGEERRRRDAAGERMAALRSKDSGGDLKL